MQEFSGKTCVVTGGASGIGLGLARRAAAEGMNVVIGDVEKVALDAALDELRTAGATVEGIVTDVTDPDAMQALADGAAERFGGVALFCNNAGVGGGGLSWELPLKTWEWIVGVDLWGVVHGVRSFVPLLMQQPEAHIVNTASLAGLVAAPFMGPYNVAKHGVVALSETLHHELAMAAPHVKVSVLCPGWVKTNIADSVRNRPDHLQEAEGELGAQSDSLRGFLESGMSPDVVASKVFDAVRAEQFWVLTHDDEADFWVDAVNRRLRSIEQRSNPGLDLPT
jgi:NAD(P)-dependent dehydrogenase (short-subunit alcohol dehydrogenase family)